MRRSYTLIEILVAVSIIAILTATGLGITSYVRNKVAETQTKTTIKLIEMAFQKFHEKNGGYPTRAEYTKDELLVLPDITSTTTFDDLWKCFNDVTLGVNGATKIRGIRLQYDSSVGYYVLDGWGRKIYYLQPGVFNSETYDLISFGGDKLAGDGSTNKSIGDTDFKYDTGAKKYTGFENKSIYPDELGDDITNFTRN